MEWLTWTGVHDLVARTSIAQTRHLFDHLTQARGILAEVASSCSHSIALAPLVAPPDAGGSLYATTPSSRSARHAGPT